MTRARDLLVSYKLKSLVLVICFYYRPKKLNGYRIKFENNVVIGLFYWYNSICRRFTSGAIDKFVMYPIEVGIAIV